MSMAFSSSQVVNDALTRMVLGWMAQKCKESCPRGDDLAAHRR